MSVAVTAAGAKGFIERVNRAIFILHFDEKWFAPGYRRLSPAASRLSNVSPLLYDF